MSDKDNFNLIQILIDKISSLEKKIDSFEQKTVTWRHIHHLLKVNNQTCMLHQKTFSKYRGIFIDKNVYLIATGPTLQYFVPDDPEGIYVGVNAAFLNEKIKLDYLFAQDYSVVKSYINEMNLYRPDTCKKFYGQLHYGSYSIMNIPDYHAIKANAERYVYDTTYYENTVIFTNDISTQPIPAIPISFAALQFILWGCAKKVFLIGCDCSSNGHFKKVQPERDCSDQFEAWTFFKAFSQKFYPDTEIISVNPVGLKGMFRDVYTKEYLNDHPEINPNEVEIMENNYE